MRRVRVIPELRNSHFEESTLSDDICILYSNIKPDLDLSEVPTSARRGGLLRIAFWMLSRRWDVVEIPEVLWLRALPLTLVSATAAKLGGALRSTRTIVGTYCIENNELERLLAPYNVLGRIVHYLLRGFTRNAVDRWAFGSSQSMQLYSEGKFIGPTSEQILQWDLPAPCACSSSVKSKEHLFLFVAALEERKGVNQLLRAWKKSKLGQHGWILRIAGTGELVENVREAASYDSSVEYLGKISRVTMHEQMLAASAVVLPSVMEGRWREQIGLPIAEGLAHGSKIITSADSGLADWLTDRAHLVLPSSYEIDDLANAMWSCVHSVASPIEVLSTLPRRRGRVIAEEWIHREN